MKAPETSARPVAGLEKGTADAGETAMGRKSSEERETGTDEFSVRKRLAVKGRCLAPQGECPPMSQHRADQTDRKYSPTMTSLHER